MSISQRISYFLLAVYFFGVGCAPTLPKSEYPAEQERVVHASLDRVWDAVVEVIKISDGTVITKDKASGLITYVIINKESDYRVYMNVYLKNRSETDTTVYLTSKAKGKWPFLQAWIKETDKDFYEKLNARISGGG